MYTHTIININRLYIYEISLDHPIDVSQEFCQTAAVGGDAALRCGEDTNAPAGGRKTLGLYLQDLDLRAPMGP